MMDQAKCLCYDKNGQFNPNPFDDQASSCYERLKDAKNKSSKKVSETLVDFCSKNMGTGPTTAVSDPSYSHVLGYGA